MYQLPVNNITRIRKARKQVKRALGDIGLEFCQEAAKEYEEFCPDDQLVQDSAYLDISAWDPSYSKTQEYRSKPFCCSECSFSSKYYSGYKNHFRNVHRDIFEDILLNCPYCTFTANKRTMDTHIKIFHQARPANQTYGKFKTTQQTALKQKDKALLDRGRQMDGVEKAMYYCKKCTFRDSLYNVVRRHIYREHFQHIVSPYLRVVSESSVKNGASSVNGNNILCKCCQFSTRSYEALVQHVVEYHERIGGQVTTMIGHANVMVSRAQAMPVVAQKAPIIINRAQTLASEASAKSVIGYLKPVTPVIKNHSPIAVQQMRSALTGNTSLAENNATGVNTAQTQKWKICTVCNELFPENLYSAHFETAHKAIKVWAMAKYIMKIHNFTSKCLLCNRYLPSDTLLNHVLIHGLTCPQCHSAFHSVEKLIEHEKQAHAGEFYGPPGASPLTFDLTVKQDKSINVQLLVLTFNTKDTVNGQEDSVPGHNSVVAPVRITPPKMIEKKNQALARGIVPSPLSGQGGVGKTLCPLCFTILRGPISDALAMHLRERHQVLQTMHPVERKMTYKCIHCLGVYTSNMVASTITLHLVQCRAVGRNQAGLTSPLTLSASGVGFLKRQLPMQTPFNAKRLHLGKGLKTASTAAGNQAQSGLALDPASFEHKTYESRKDFLTAYFNKCPYPTAQEQEKLSSSLWLWKNDIATHFAAKRRMCENRCQTGKLSVLLGFDMDSLKRLKHDMIFEERGASAQSVQRPEEFKPTINADQKKQDEMLNCTLKVSTCTETISIDSDSEPETESLAQNGSVETDQQNIEDPKAEAEESQPVETDEPRPESSLNPNTWMAAC